MAQWGKLLSRGIVEDRRNDPLPRRVTRPMVAESVPNLGLPRIRQRPKPGTNVSDYMLGYAKAMRRGR